MPWCPGAHCMRIGQFHGIFISILEKKARKPGKQGKYSPFCTWDFYTDLSYRTVVLTVCISTWLLSSHCVFNLLNSPWLYKELFSWFGGYAGNGMVFSSCDCDTGLIYKHCSDVSSTTASMCKFAWTNASVSQLYHFCHYMPLILMLSNDIERNPGPTTEELITGLAERLESRIDRFTTEFRSMSTSVNNMADRLEQITEQLKEKEKDMQDMKEKMDNMERKMTRMEDELERQHIFSRRDNMIFYGIPERPETETHDDCARTISDLLNKASRSSRVWSMDDIARAHRLGKPSTKQRPIIIKLQRSRDKQTLITDRHFKEELKKTNIAVSDDLTKQQRQTLKEHRDRGFIAYFRGPRLFTRPATQRGHGNVETRNDSDNDTVDEESSCDQVTPTVPSPPPSTSCATPPPSTSSLLSTLPPTPSPSRNTDAGKTWRQFREQSRERSSRSSVDRQRGSVSDGRNKDNTPVGNVQTRSKVVNGKGKRQNRIDSMLGSGSRGASR